MIAPTFLTSYVRNVRRSFVILPSTCFECDRPEVCIIAEICYANHKGYPKQYFKDSTPVEIYENPEGTYVNDLDTRTNN